VDRAAAGADVRPPDDVRALIQFDRRGSGMSDRVPPAPRRPATGAGASCSTATTRSSAARSRRTAGRRSRRWATASSPPSTARPARSAALQVAEARARRGSRYRAGIHTGECERVGNDVAGIAVHLAARVMAEAGSGQVLVSRTVTDLVAGSGLRFESRGAHALRGVPGEWELFQAA
jgi:class 3 adenylate cyclase